MNKYEEQRMTTLREKYLPKGELEWEYRRNGMQSTPSTLQPSRHEVDRVEELKRKFNLPNGLQVEGLPPKQIVETVAEFAERGEQARKKKVISELKACLHRENGEITFLEAEITL